MLTRPATPLVARLTGMRNVFPARVVRVLPGALEVQTARFAVRTPPFPFPAGAPVSLHVRPDAVTLVRELTGRPTAAAHRRTRRCSTDASWTTSTWGRTHTLYVRLLGAADAPEDAPAPWSGPPTGGAGAPYDLEVDVAALPYRELGVADRPDWTLALPFDALHVTAGEAVPAAPVPGGNSAVAN